jgi:hypothetical protein
LLQMTVEPGGTTTVEAGAGGGGLLLLIQPASKAAGARKTNQRSMRCTFQKTAKCRPFVKFPAIQRLAPPSVAFILAMPS